MWRTQRSSVRRHSGLGQISPVNFDKQHQEKKQTPPTNPTPIRPNHAGAGRDSTRGELKLHGMKGGRFGLNRRYARVCRSFRLSPAKQVALQIGHAVLDEDDRLLLRLDALGGRLHPELRSELSYGSDDR